MTLTNVRIKARMHWTRSQVCTIRNWSITSLAQNRLTTRASNRTWTRTVNPNEPFHFGEPEPNLNQQNFTSVNLNQTWTLKIVLKWTQTEPEPLTKVRIYFSISECRWRWYTHNKSSGDHQQDQQFLRFFFLDETSNDSWILSQWTRTEPEPVIFYLSEPEPNLNLENGAQVNPSQTWTAKIFWAGAKPEPEPLFETVRHPAYYWSTILSN